LVEVKKGSYKIKMNSIKFRWSYKDKNSVYIYIDETYNARLVKREVVEN